MKEQIRKPHHEEEHPPERDISATPQADTGDLDGLLDEIDEVLEENAEEFVRNYVQKGGE
ncbi:MAG: ubiquitin-like protein Pup [Acidimicrobiia bacterium]